MNYHDNSPDFSNLYKLSDIVCNLDESTDNRTETFLSLPIKISGMTKQTNNGTFTRSAYIQTRDNNYPITSKTPGISDCGVQVLVYNFHNYMYIHCYTIILCFPQLFFSFYAMKK